MTRQGDRPPDPLPPEPPEEDRVVDHDDLTAHEEWEDEIVTGADLAGAVAASVHMTRCELRGVTLTGAQLRGLNLVDVLAVDCELSGAVLTEGHLRRVEFRNCRMSGVVLGQATLDHVRFAGCKLDEASFRLAQLEHAELADCSLRAADFLESRLTDVALRDCDLREADFSKVVAPGLRLAGSNLEGLRGGLSLRGAVIEGDQTISLALSLFAELGIELRNDG